MHKDTVKAYDVQVNPPTHLHGYEVLGCELRRAS
jgi:hypothetical protein